MQDYGIDNHKLMYHVDRVQAWREGRLIYPIYIEVSPVGSCNHRCTFCALDFMEYQQRSLDTALLKERLREMGALGVKSIMYAGEGEPFLHGDIADIAVETKKAGIDVAFTSNGTMLSEKIAQKILPHTTWIKISISAGTEETYAALHKTKPADFERVFKNLAAAARIRREQSGGCTLGMQMILLPDNAHEAGLLAERARDIGMDYLVIKPYSQHPQSKTRIYKEFKCTEYADLTEKLQKYDTDSFKVIVRVNTIKKLNTSERGYKHCPALSFWSYIDAGGNLWACSMYMNQEQFRLGNLYEQGFRDIWESEKHRQLHQWAREKMDTSLCRVNCRMDESNRYLWSIENPSSHVNFI